MSKHKNPLKDLDLFLKQQAASFVSPVSLSEKIQTHQIETTSEGQVDASPEELIHKLEQLSFSNRQALYDIIIKVAEKQPSLENTMLINTALYLKSGDNWKDVIRQYWRGRNS